VAVALNSGKYALPYYISNGVVQPYPPDVNKIVEVAGPAGSIISSIKDLANWLIFQLNLGNFGGKQVISKENLAATWKPSMFMPSYFLLPRPIFPAEVSQATYGMGWWDGSYRGHAILQHGGNVIGHSALNLFLPNDGIGISILTNMDALGLPQMEIAWYAIDLLLGYQPWLNSSNTCNFPCSFIKCNKDTQPESIFGHKSNIKEFPIKDIEEYVGTYVHPAYGSADISIASSILTISWNTLSGKLTPTGQDIFMITGDIGFTQVSIPVQFTRNFKGVVDHLLMSLEPTVAPIVFVNHNVAKRDEL